MNVIMMSMMIIISPVGPTCAVGALFWSVRRIHINRVCFYIPPYDELKATVTAPFRGGGRGRML